MAWTKIIGPEEAQGELSDLYHQVKSRKVSRFPEFLVAYTQEPGGRAGHRVAPVRPIESQEDVVSSRAKP